MLDHLPSSDAIPVETLELDDFETGILAVLRHFLTTYAQPDSQGWQTAFKLAAERWGDQRGPQIAMSLLPVLQALRRARRSDFDFANPLCVTCRAYVTGTEAAFLIMLQAMRRNHTNRARHAVLSLTEGTADPVLIQSALVFATRYRLDPDARAGHGATDDLQKSTGTHRPGRGHLRLIH